MTDTKRITIRFDLEIWEWLENNHRANGHSNPAKFANSIISQYVKSKIQPEEPVQEVPLTPEEEVDKIVEEIGKLNEQYNDKFEAIRSLIPKDAPNIQTLEDLKKRANIIWTKVKEKNGYVRAERNKVVPISKNDLKCYELLCELHVRKRELEKVMSVAAVAGAQ